MGRGSISVTEESATPSDVRVGSLNSFSSFSRPSTPSDVRVASSPSEAQAHQPGCAKITFSTDVIKELQEKQSQNPLLHRQNTEHQEVPFVRQELITATTIRVEGRLD